MTRFATLYLLLILNLCSSLSGQSKHPQHPFTVRDDIAITQFGDINDYYRNDMVISRSKQYVVVHTFGENLARNEIVDSLYFYRVSALTQYAESNASQEPLPLWVLRRSSTSAFSDGPLMTQLRWLPNDSGVAFLMRSSAHQTTLDLASLKERSLQVLTPAGQSVLSFSVNDRHHYVYTVASPVTKKPPTSTPDVRLGNDISLYSILNPHEGTDFVRRAELWSVRDGHRKLLRFQTGKEPLILFDDGVRELSLSPDNKKALTILPLEKVPNDWPQRFPPPYPNASIRITAGSQDLSASTGASYIGLYVWIDLETAAVHPITGTPAAFRAGWFESFASSAWSSDSSSVALADTFLPSQNAGTPPCVVFARLLKGSSPECVVPLKRDLPTGTEAGYSRIKQIGFEQNRNDAISILHDTDDSGVSAQEECAQEDHHWSCKKASPPMKIELKVKMDIWHSPVLSVRDLKTGNTRTVLDPNPQLKDVELGARDLYEWNDGTGRTWQAVLYKPLGFKLGVRYPLVIQNHGYSTSKFTPSGGFPSAFAAEELAAAGIMVLQMRDCAGRGTPLEGPCNVLGYGSAVDSLDKQGMIDPTKVGIIGFSRTVYYVLEALTSSKLHLRAASITDGMNLGYLNYVLDIGPSKAGELLYEGMIGSIPVGDGLTLWSKRSPVFNVDKINAPVRIVASRHVSQMWEPYALLKRLGKPVDFLIFNTEEHVFTKPSIRFAAQEGNVDWFRFWLQGWEDPSPMKQDQYRRWRRLRGSEATLREDRLVQK